MKKILSVFTLIVFLSTNAQIKILFDATKAEMAGNADWVIDADEFNLRTNSNSTVTIDGRESNPQRFPTPDQSNITSTTPENFWTGGISGWAIDLVKHGYFVETLPYDGRITYNDSTNPQDLSNYKVFIVTEPNSQFTMAEKDAIINFVKNGGGLYMIADHDNSDRNGDGWDSPAIWNDLVSTNYVVANPFGITFDIVTFSQTTTNFANIPSNTILNGSAGTPKAMQFSSGASMTLNKTANPSVQGLVFKTGASTTGTTNVMFATATYGAGKVCALGDSSVPDDGTGDTGDNLYNGYFADASGNHRPLLINSVIWLATSSGLATDDIMKPELSVNIYPNPSSDYVYVQSKTSEKYHLTLMDSSGKVLQSIPNTDKISITSYPKGIYYLVIKNDKGFKNFKVEKK
ncbi:T9SS type A sorting domain-containing protein [Cloacibacterium normanense]|uniref:T9SS type A sorting domain-containing protein n=1 Tax=Cloacibacterium normanense TaxID=237258 RepID=UPI00352D01E9